MTTELTAQDLTEHIVESLAEARGITRAEVDAEISAAGGDLRIDSKEGEFICVVVEDALGLGDLVEAADLEPEQLSSISALTQLFLERLMSVTTDPKDAA